MCSCDMGVVCSKCAGTPFDPRYEEDAHEPMSPLEFDALADTYRPQEDWQERFWSL